MEPALEPETDQVTAVDSPTAPAETVAEKVVVPPVRTLALPGVMVTTCGEGGVTVITAVPLTVVSAALVATTVQLAPAWASITSTSKPPRNAVWSS